MARFSEDAGRWRTESDRCRDHREEIQGRHLSWSTSRPTEQDIRNREVMASRHNLSRVQTDQSPIKEASMVVIASSRRRPVTETHQSSSMRHRHHFQPTKDAAKRVGKHKSTHEQLREQQSRRKQELSEEPESSQQTDMPPRKKRAAQPKPSPIRMGRNMKATNDQTLKG